ncbi:MAG: precorrin-4 C(11)-methyltransferase [Chloroflexota bacterium]
MTNRFDFSVSPGTVYIVGAGPGAPDLIAVRGRDIIAQADLILYADSLVEASVAELARKPDARIVASSGLHLGEIMDLMVETAQNGGVVARIHSGDPALYGATHEQMAHLEDHGIPYEIVPGITAAFAAAALLKTELTVPDVVQTIILTRTAGRTTMPAGEDLRTLAASGASLAIYLSVTRTRHVVDDLLASGAYDETTPVAVLHKVTWPDESWVTGVLGDIAEKVRQAKYTKHALILVSPALDPALKGDERRTSSHLYDASYTHRFRRAADTDRTKERQEAAQQDPSIVAGEKHLKNADSRVDEVPRGTGVLAVTRRGSQLASQLSVELDAGSLVPEKFGTHSGNGSGEKEAWHGTYAGSVLNAVQSAWSRYERLVLIMPTGIAVRAIGPLLTHKTVDPCVICLDEQGRSVIPLLGGHQAGANRLAEKIAHITGGHAAITTASDLQDKPALDLLGKEIGWTIAPQSALTHASAVLVNDEMVGVVVDLAAGENGQVNKLADQICQQAENLSLLENLDELDLDTFAAGIIISDRKLSAHHQHLLAKSVLYRPQTLVAGMGCRRGVDEEELQEALLTTLSDANLVPESLSTLATVDLKADEAGLQTLAHRMGLPLKIVESDELRALNPTDFSPSAAQEKLGLPGVAEPCAQLVSQGRLVVSKQAFERCTVAVAGVVGNSS